MNRQTPGAESRNFENAGSVFRVHSQYFQITQLTPAFGFEEYTHLEIGIFSYLHITRVARSIYDDFGAVPENNVTRMMNVNGESCRAVIWREKMNQISKISPSKLFFFMKFIDKSLKSFQKNLLRLIQPVYSLCAYIYTLHSMRVSYIRITAQPSIVPRAWLSEHVTLTSFRLFVKSSEDNVLAAHGCEIRSTSHHDPRSHLESYPGLVGTAWVDDSILHLFTSSLFDSLHSFFARSCTMCYMYNVLHVKKWQRDGVSFSRCRDESWQFWIAERHLRLSAFRVETERYSQPEVLSYRIITSSSLKKSGTSELCNPIRLRIASRRNLLFQRFFGSHWKHLQVRIL